MTGLVIVRAGLTEHFENNFHLVLCLTQVGGRNCLAGVRQACFVACSDCSQIYDCNLGRKYFELGRSLGVSFGLHADIDLMQFPDISGFQTWQGFRPSELDNMNLSTFPNFGRIVQG